MGNASPQFGTPPLAVAPADPYDVGDQVTAGDRVPEGISDPTARSGQVAGILRAGILDGTYPADAPLPTQLDLARQHGISEATVNRAFAELAREGMVRTGSGRRTV